MNIFYKNILFSAKTILVTGTLISLGLQTASAQQNNSRDKINVGLIYPLSSNGMSAPRDTNRFSLNLIAGVSAKETGTAIAGFSNIIHKDSRSINIAGFSNHVGQRAEGLQLAGFMNTSRQGKGAEVAGFMNSSGDLNGVQFVGFLNLAKKVQGIQFAGFMNNASIVKGSQFSGFINIAKKVSGAQVAGFINIADSSDFSIGIINLIKNGEKSIGVTIDENSTFMLDFRSGGKVMYGVIGLGYNARNKKQVYAYEAGLGAHLLNSGIFRLNAELVAGGLTSFHKDEYFKSSFRLMPAVKLGKIFELFGGPSLNYISTDTAEGHELNKHALHTFTNRPGGDYRLLTIGYTVGIQVRF